MMFGANKGPGGVGGGISVQQQQQQQPPIHDVVGAPDACISRVKWAPATCPLPLIGATAWDKSVRVWQVNYNPSTAQVQSQPMAMVQAAQPPLDVSFSSDGRAFFGGCCKTAMEWNLTTNQTRQVGAHDLPISAVEYVNTNAAAPEMLITTSWDGKVRFWDLRQPTPAKEEALGQPVHCMDARTSPMATFCTGRKIVVYNLQQLSQFATLEPHNMMKYGFRCIANYKNHSAFLTGSSEGRVAAVPLDGQRNAQLGCCFKAHCIESGPTKTLYQMYPTNFVSMNPESTTGVSGGGDGAVRFWSMTSKARTFELAPRLHNGQAVACSAGDLSPTGNLVAFALSYDWSMGKDGYDKTQPTAISVLPVNPAWLK